MAHLPLWTIYEPRGWGTRALGYLKRVGSVKVHNGRIHQIIQKVDGNLTFHTAASTAFRPPVPGAAPAPGMKEVHAGELHEYLGIRTVNYVRDKGAPALTDSQLIV
jgi:3',5'-cyclic-AMP phosphodiesterase